MQNILGIYQSAIQLSAAKNSDELYESIVEEACKLVKAKHGSIFIPSKGRLRRVYSSVPLRSQFEPRKDGYTHKTFSTQKIHILSRELLKETHPEFTNKRIKSVVLIPLSYDKESIGALSLQATQKKFTEKKLAMLKLYGSFASLQIQSTRLIEDKNRALASRDLFIATAAHELKTPITVVKAYAQLVNKSSQAGELISPQMTRTLVNELDRLTQLIDELLSIEHVSKGEFEYTFEPFAPANVINKVLNFFKVFFPKRKLIFVEKGDPAHKKILGDPKKIHQVFINLLQNAVKFSAPDTAITLEVNASDADFMFHIKDQGRGIPKKELPKVFEQFYRGKKAQHEGMGLGLFLCKKIVEQHHGKIDITSKAGKGTSISVQLPFYT